MNTADHVQVVTFRLGSQEFAFDILQIERILRYEVPAPLPKAPPFLEGVMPYAGGAVPVVDLRKRFDGVVALDGLELDLVDEVQEVLRVDSTTIVAPGPMVSGLAAVYIAGIVSRPGRTIIILNARKLLTSTERLSLTGVGA